MSNQHAGSTGSGRKSGQGFVDGDGTHDCPAGFPVKGNASSKLAHLPGGRWYDATIPELCFATPEDAEDEGYRVTGAASERTWVRGDGSHACPDGFPVKGNLSSMIAHPPGSRYFDATIPEVCFATAEAAQAQGYRISGAAGAAAHPGEAPRAAEGIKTEAEPAPHQPSAGSSAATGEQNVETMADVAEASDENAATLAAPAAETSIEGDRADQPPGGAETAAPAQSQTVAPAPHADQPSRTPAAQVTTEAATSKPSSPTAAFPAQAESKRRSIRHDGSLDCPTDFPIKGIERTRTAVGPSDPGYHATMPDICFETIGDAIEEGYRSLSDLAVPRARAAAPTNEPPPNATIVIRIKRWWVKRKSPGS